MDDHPRRQESGTEFPDPQSGESSWESLASGTKKKQKKPKEASEACASTLLFAMLTSEQGINKARLAAPYGPSGGTCA